MKKNSLENLPNIVNGFFPEPILNQFYW